MRQFINLVESFSFSPENIRTEFENNTKFYSFDIDGKEFVVGFNGDFDEEGGDFYVSFTGDDGRGRQTARLTNDNTPMRVLGSVASIVEQFIAEHEPDQIEFSVESDEEKRGITYDRILEYLSKKQRLPDGYEWDRDQNYNFYIFKDGYR